MASWLAFQRGLICAVAWLAGTAPLAAQNSGALLQQGVGGVSIDTDGTLKAAQVDQTNHLRQAMVEAMQPVPDALAPTAELRKISLRQLEQTVAALLADGEPLPDEIRYLAGLQSIRYVFVYPERKDIVLAGYAEGWLLDKRGNVVGRVSGRPVMRFDDLLVALRWALAGEQKGPIACSIDPSAEGMAKLQDIAAKLTNISQLSTDDLAKTLGSQAIRVEGIDASTHLARTIVAADYRMKRFGMKLEPSPVLGLPSYIDLLVRRSQQGLETPRWWMVPNYLPLFTDADGLAWEIRGSSVTTMAEETLFAQNGARQGSQAASPEALQWANKFTEKYSHLAVKEPVFGELRNVMELALASALIIRHRLAEKADYRWQVFADASQLSPEVYDTPRTVPTQASITRKGTNYVISASGGVEIRPEQFLDRVERNPAVDTARQAATPKPDTAWWWN
ncbi:MAG: DUF1598 domain-containing protein [Planctomycetes bacterium]|nr:DUF1598 domain-containing protein [Planctomycetota bacterium]